MTSLTTQWIDGDYEDPLHKVLFVRKLSAKGTDYHLAPLFCHQHLVLKRVELNLERVKFDLSQCDIFRNVL